MAGFAAMLSIASTYKGLKYVNYYYKKDSGVIFIV